MQKKMSVLQKMIECIAFSSFGFAVITWLSSVNTRSNVLPEYFCVQRGAPLKFIFHTNQMTSVNYMNALFDFCVILVSIIVFQFFIVSYRKLLKPRALKSIGVIIAVSLLFFHCVPCEAAVATYVNSWRLIHNGKLRYNAPAKYQDYVSFAERTWNAYKPGVIEVGSQSCCDVIIKESDKLSADIAGITRSNGVIYFGTLAWGWMERDEKRNCAMHEIGHALGLAHASDTNSVMYHTGSKVTKLSATDKASYDLAYALSFIC